MSDDSLIRTYLNGVRGGAIVLWVLAVVIWKLFVTLGTMALPMLLGLVYFSPNPTSVTGHDLILIFALQIAWLLFVWVPAATVIHRYGYTEYFIVTTEE